MPTLTPSSEDVRVYEIAVMYPSDLAPKEENQLMKDIDAIFAEAHAKLLFKDAWSRRGLAFKIKGRDEAKFTIYYYEADSSTIRAIDTALRLERNIMRHMVLIPPAGYEAVSFEDKYKNWMDTRETRSEMRVREKEEKVKEQMKSKAKGEARRAEAAQKKKRVVKDDAPKRDISSELDKLISDEDLNI